MTTWSVVLYREKPCVFFWPQDALLIFNLRTILEAGSFFRIYSFHGKAIKTHWHYVCVYIKKHTNKKRMSKIKSFELIERSNLWVITISNEIRYNTIRVLFLQSRP